MPTLPGFRRVVTITNQTASNQGLQAYSGEQSYTVLPDKERDKLNRPVYVAEIKGSLNGGQYQSEGRLYFSFAPDGTRRIHGIQRRDNPIWFSDFTDLKNGYIPEIPGKMTVGAKFPIFDIVADLESPLHVDVECIGQETVTTTAGIFKNTFRCVGSGEVTQQTPFGKVTAPETFFFWIAPKVGIVKYAYKIDIKIGSTKTASLYEQEAVAIGRGAGMKIGRLPAGSKFQQVQVKQICPDCSGGGKARCEPCQGTGRVSGGDICDDCSGTGRSRFFSCATCHGLGYVLVWEQQPIRR